MSNKEQMFEYLESICEFVPVPFWWVNLDGVALGCNKPFLESAGVSKEFLIGKTPFDMYEDKQIARQFKAWHDEVIRTKSPLQIEQRVINISTQQPKYFAGTYAPLFNANDIIIGIVGTGVDITAQKEAERLKDELNFVETLLKLSPGYIYAKDLNGKYLGCNLLSATIAGYKSIEETMGRTDYDMPWKEYADSMRAVDIQVAETGNSITLEEKSIFGDRHRIMLSHKEPLHNKNGKIIGIIGTSVDITDRKEKEQAVAKEQEKFKTVVKQTLHDIQSPLSSLATIVVEQSNNIPENTRITLRNATDRIGDITNNLLNQYTNNKDDIKNKNTALLVSLAILQIMSEKRYQYKDNTNIIFYTDFDKLANFAFVQINPADFKRMLSNLVNNAVEALQGKSDGKVEVELAANSKNVILYVRDNGYGMPQHIRDSFYAEIPITEGKENGHGVGLNQIHDTVYYNGGTCKIYVENNVSTEIVIKFPIIPTPFWIASEIKINNDDTIIILDDDNSIHGAWDSKFAAILEEFPTITIKHYTYGQDVIEYVKRLSPEQKQNTLLLTDYELLNQGMNGLDVVKNTGMLRAILVTSHASNPEIQELVIQAGIKTLPKELVPVVTIKVDKKIPKWSKCVDMVWAEDQRWFVDSIVSDYYSHLTIDIYSEPNSFMEEIHQYPLDTRIILDTYYSTPDNKITYSLDGFTIAKMLNEMGYTKLILFSGEVVEPSRIPNYLTVILKNDLEAKKSLDKI